MASLVDMSVVRLSLCAALCGLLLSACTVPTVSLAEGPREYVATDYDLVLQKWTRTKDLIELAELENFLTATATFESWDFRWAYAVRYVQDYRLTIEQRKKLLEKALDETRQRHQFFVALYGGEGKQADLSKPDSAWIVRLIDDTGNETAPEEIVAVNKSATLERTYFPYSSVWRTAFRIRFPKTLPDGRPTISPVAKWFGLRFAGARGNSELVWQVQEEGAEPAEPAPPVSAAAEGEANAGTPSETRSRSRSPAYIKPDVIFEMASKERERQNLSQQSSRAAPWLGRPTEPYIVR